MPMRSIRYLGLFGDLRFGVGHLSFGEVVVRSFYVFVINLFIIHGFGFLLGVSGYFYGVCQEFMRFF